MQILQDVRQQFSADQQSGRRATEVHFSKHDSMLVKVHHACMIHSLGDDVAQSTDDKPPVFQGVPVKYDQDETKLVY